MRVAVFGANGMAGSMVTAYLKSVGHSVTEITRNELNISNKEDINRLLYNLEERKVDFIINCVGLLVKASQERPDMAIHINASFPQYLAHKLSTSPMRIVHLSTDCVYDGKEGYYTEDVPHNEMNFYGRSKSLGEIDNNKDLTLRMSIIGPERKENGTGLFHWLVNKTGDLVGGYTNAHWNGITTLELARAIDIHIRNPINTGIYNLVPEFSISKYELLCEINEIFELGKTIKPIESEKKINKILVDTRKTFEYLVPEYNVQLYYLRKFMVEYYGI